MDDSKKEEVLTPAQEEALARALLKDDDPLLTRSPVLSGGRCPPTMSFSYGSGEHWGSDPPPTRTARPADHIRALGIILQVEYWNLGAVYRGPDFEGS